MNVESFLRSRGVDFDVLPHRTEFTASRTAQALHVPGAHFAKTVVLKVDNRPVLAVVPANRHVDIDSVRRELHAQTVQLAREEEFSRLFPDCELGAVPPFGSEYNMQTILDDDFAPNEHIVFEGNTHNRAIYMRYDDYTEIEHPHVAHIAN
jgi:Ala-tRNA(Pro) deacylase